MGRAGARHGIPRGKSWLMDLGFDFLIYHPLLFCSDKSCHQLTATLAAMNAYHHHEHLPPGKQRTVWNNDPGWPMPSNLTGRFTYHRMQFKYEKDFWGQSGIGSEFASQILLGVVSSLMTETKVDSNPDFECPCSVPLRAMGYLG